MKVICDCEELDNFIFYNLGLYFMESGNYLSALLRMLITV
jgi:hypothetical protein